MTVKSYMRSHLRNSSVISVLKYYGGPRSFTSIVATSACRLIVYTRQYQLYKLCFQPCSQLSCLLARAVHVLTDPMLGTLSTKVLAIAICRWECWVHLNTNWNWTSVNQHNGSTIISSSDIVTMATTTFPSWKAWIVYYHKHQYIIMPCLWR